MFGRAAVVLPCRVLFLIVMLLAQAASQAQDWNAWNRQYKDQAAASRAEQLESASQAVFRYRVAIVGLLQLKPGMTAADIGAGSGFLSRVMAQQVGPSGRVFATERDPKMVAYVADRARAEGLANVVAVQEKEAATGLEPATVDAVAVVNAFSGFSKPREMVESIAATLKPGGTLLIVDLPREGQGPSATGIDADDVVALVTAAGFARISESTVVPGQYAIRFRKQ
jgi:protein-L-isoaspartate O-methyltransferase